MHSSYLFHIHHFWAFFPNSTSSRSPRRFGAPCRALHPAPCHVASADGVAGVHGSVDVGGGGAGRWWDGAAHGDADGGLCGTGACGGTAPSGAAVASWGPISVLEVMFFFGGGWEMIYKWWILHTRLWNMDHLMIDDLLIERSKVVIFHI